MVETAKIKAAGAVGATVVAAVGVVAVAVAGVHYVVAKRRLTRRFCSISGRRGTTSRGMRCGRSSATTRPNTRCSTASSYCTGSNYNSCSNRHRRLGRPTIAAGDLTSMAAAAEEEEEAEEASG